MSVLAGLQERLRDTGAAIAQYERAIAKSQSPSLLAGLKSLQKRLAILEADFLAVTDALGIDVCSYRLFSNEVKRPLAAAVGTALADFQELFSTVYDAILKGPRQRILTSTSSAREDTALRFGYGFDGSVGIVLTLDNHQMLVESDLDAAMGALFDLASSRSTEQLLASNRILGAPSLKAVKKWAGSHVKYGLGTEVIWMHGKTEKRRLFLQIPEIKRLSELLEEAAEPTEEEVVLEGTVGGNETISSHRVHFVSDDGIEIRCPFASGVISERNPVLSPARYRATFKKSAKKIISSGEETDVSWLLIRLKHIS